MATKSAEKRVAILQGVYTVGCQLGMSGISIATVAKVAGVPKSVVLYHFGRREELLDAALEAWITDVQGRIQGALEPRTRDPRDRLGAWILALFAADMRGWQLYLQLSLEPPSAPASGRAAAFEREVERGLAGLLAQGHKQLAWRAARPRAMATGLRCLVEGLVLTCVRAGEPSAMAAAQAMARQQALDLLLR